jgi:predicted membrane-bound spermidine synthase
MRHSLPKVMLVALGLLVCSVDAAEPQLSLVFDKRRVLLVPTAAGPGALTMSMLDGSRTGYYWDLGERAGVLRPKAKRVVMLGLGGGEMLRAARRTLPKADLLGIDIDPAMLRAARDEFRIGAFGARGELADAFVWVKKARGVDVLIVDLFNGDTMPEASLKVAFWRDCAAAVAPGGLVMVNVYPALFVPQVAGLLEVAGLREVERHTPDGTGAVIIAER